MLLVVPTASDTLQMLLRLLQELVGLNRQPELLFTTFAEQNTFPKHGALSAVGSLRGGDPAVHFHVCEVLHVLSALWGGDGGHNVLQAQEHGEEQDQEESQEG